MGVSVADTRSRSTTDSSATPGIPAQQVPAARRRTLRIPAGRIVSTEAALALLLAGSGRGPLVATVTTSAALALLLGTWVRVRRRWLSDWLSAALRYLARRHTAPAGPAALLDLVCPDAQVTARTIAGDAGSTIDDGHGLTAVLEVDDRAGLTGDTALPPPAGLLPGSGLPPTRIQMLLTGSPAPLARVHGAAATSYRQLTGGRVLGHRRVLLAVRVLRVEGWSDDDLVRALSSTVRKVRKRLTPVAARPLDADATLRVLAEAAHHDGAHPVRESWPAMHLGGQPQASFHLPDWPEPREREGWWLVLRLLTLPATATTVSLTVGPRGGTGPIAVDATVRLAAADTVALSAATQALHRLLDAEGTQARRLDGGQLGGLAATLPLGLAAPRTPVAAEGADLPLGVTGLMVGTDRHGSPLAVRVFRTEPTHAVLIGGLPAAQLITLRAMALGARVVVQTVRPAAWEPFTRGAAGPGDRATVVPPGTAVGGQAGSPLHPLLVVIDTGAPAAARRPGAGCWQAELVVRDELTPADLDLVRRADVAFVQPLRADEAALAGADFALGESAHWLTRVPADMVAVRDQRALRWALLCPTQTEIQLVGSPARPDRPAPSR